MVNNMPENWEKTAIEHQNKYKQILKRTNKNVFLKQLQPLHNEAFSKIDCKDCAACCKNYSPRFTGPDIRRVSKYLGMKEGEFKETYLRVDEDGDYVTHTKPCPFLGDDNLCTVYDSRPSDCNRFPYTDEDVLLKRPTLTLKNVTFCPAVFYVLERIKTAP